MMTSKALTLAIICLVAAAAFAQTTTNTTQASNNDEVSTENTTTTAGTTSSQSTPTTSPPLSAEPEAGKWFINSTGKNICLMVNLGARFTFNYNITGGKNHTEVKDLPFNNSITTPSGNCSEQTSYIILSYKPACGIRMDFQDKDKKFTVDKISVSFDTKCFDVPPEGNVAGSLVNQTLFKTSVGQSYMCNSQQNFNITDNNINQMTLELVDLQLQAFMNQTTANFGTAQECPQDAETSNIVPIAVGAALAALVLIVLIAYLISRNRGQRGYESV